MARLLVLLTALMLSFPVLADNHKEKDKGRAEEKKALRIECEHEANRQDLVGKERRKFVKDCAKDSASDDKKKRKNKRRDDKESRKDLKDRDNQAD